MQLHNSPSANDTIDMQELHLKTQDNTILVIHKFTRSSVHQSTRAPPLAVLIVPHLGASIAGSDGFYAALARELAKEHTVYLLELRGHGLSEGSWSMKKQQEDIQWLIDELHKKNSKVLVIASGLSASIMLQAEEQTHHAQNKNALTTLPDRMLLLAPVLSVPALLKTTRTSTSHFLEKLSGISAAVLPHLLAAYNTTHKHAHLRTYNERRSNYGYCRVGASRIHELWNDVRHFDLAPVRIQTPTLVLLPQQQHEVHPVHRLFGNVRLVHVRWMQSFLHEQISAPMQAERLQGIIGATKEILSHEHPIRFRTE